MKKFWYLFFTVIALAMTACSDSDNNDPDAPDNPIDPNKEVPDPTGTIMLTMFNEDNGRTWLDNFYIGKDNNFVSYYGECSFASVGQVKGLGNVSEIPFYGWSSKVAVQPEYGYVAYDPSKKRFYRIYVTKWVYAAGSMGIMGAEIKYQQPFNGVDKEIVPENSTIVLPGEGGSQEVVFKNKSFTVFSVTSSAGWCRVQKASTKDFPFLYDAIVISADESYSATNQTAEVTIETAYGKKTVINVTRQARGEFITPGTNTLTFAPNDVEQTQSLNIFTNIEPKDIKITPSQSWISATLNDGDTRSRVQSIEGTATRAVLENPVNKRLVVTCDSYMGGSQREGYITLSYGNLSEKIEVIQQGTNFQLEQTQVEFVGEDWETMYGKAINFTCADLTLSRMGVEYASDADKWVSVSFNSGSNYQNYITVLPKANPNETDRVAKLKLVYYNSDKTNYYELATLTVKQKGRVYNDYEIFFDRNSNNYSIILPLKEGTEISSTESWCTATPSGDNLVIRATASTEDRSAIISFSNISCKIYVSQSKYAVGDAYSENGVEGKVTIMNNGKGSVYKEVGAHEWSTEFVTLSDVMDYDDGKVNTEAIKKIPDWETLYPAFAAVNQLNTGDVTGWYLPAVNQFKGTNFVSSDYYWSSTSSGSNNAMTVRNRNAYAVAKSSILWVLAFHDFDYNFHKK
ncbi:MAG: DUF5036 family protein [Bacteroidales bacterium]|nr:DUF5036 family protein [Bacteroidales bacterium]